MTEAEWLAGDDPQRMFESLIGQVSNRKLRLCEVACCDVLIAWLGHPASMASMRCAELYADGLVTEVELDSAHTAALEAYREIRGRHMPPGGGSTHFSENYADGQPDSRAALAAAVVSTGDYERFQKVAASIACHLSQDQIQPFLRCIFGNPFRPPHFDPRWRTETAVALASGIFADRAFDRLPILADALEDAGCDAAELLAHLRASGPHARGCWPLDLVLGKE